MSEFANGSLAMYPSPISGTFTFSSNFTSEDFLPPLAFLDAEDLVQLMESGGAYVRLWGGPKAYILHIDTQALLFCHNVGEPSHIGVSCW